MHEVKLIPLTLAVILLPMVLCACPVEEEPIPGDEPRFDTDRVESRQPPGHDCSCDSDCRGEAEHQPICVFGVCRYREQQYAE